MNDTRSSPRVKPFLAENPLKKRKISSFVPRWRGPEERDEYNFIYHEPDLKNKNLHDKLTLHFILCAPALFAQHRDIQRMCCHLGANPQSEDQISKYKKAMQPLGLVSRPIVRFNKNSNRAVTLGSQHAFIPNDTTHTPVLHRVYANFFRETSLGKAPNLAAFVEERGHNPVALPNRYHHLKALTAHDRDIMDLLEDYSTITLMLEKGSHIHLLRRPHSYLSSGLMVMYYQDPLFFNQKLSAKPANKKNPKSDPATHGCVSSICNTTKYSYNHSQSKIIAETALALLRASGIQTYVANYYMTEPARRVHKIFIQMCNNVLNSKDPKFKYYMNLVLRRYGYTYALWLNNAFESFLLAIRRNTFRVGRGHPRKKLVSNKNVVANTVVDRVLHELTPAIQAVGPALYKKYKKKRATIWRILTKYLYEEIQRVKRSVIFRFRLSSDICATFIRRAVDRLSDPDFLSSA